MKRLIRIGSRESRLAVIQAEIIRDRLQKSCPEYQFEIVTMKTTGDRILNKSLTEIGGKGLFVKELDMALLEGKIDLAVHSLKDMPMEESEELPILAYGEREDPRDVLIYKPGCSDFPENGCVGTSSKRRALQIQNIYPACRISGIRGNVQTRLKKLEKEAYDGTILAAAGLNRLKMQILSEKDPKNSGKEADVRGRIFETWEMIPAAGQGILAVQGREGEDAEYLNCVRSPQSRWEALAERQFVRTLDGGCNSPAAAYAVISGQQICLTGLFCDEKSGEFWTEKMWADQEKAEKLGEMLAEKLKRQYG